jgi:hypothetical protein
MTSTNTVTVACKVPNGLLLRLGEFRDYDEPVVGGGVRTSKIWRQIGEPIHIKGPKRGMVGDDPFSPNADGYALTFGVPEDFMTKWLDENKDHDLVRNNLIRVSAKTQDLKAMTKESRDVATGLEPLNPKGDARVPKSITKKTDD